MMPGRGQVDLWAAAPDSVEPDQLEALARELSPDERERAARFVLEPARRSFVVTRALLRRSLSRYADVPPEAWRFARGPHGKPHLDAAQAALGLCFNVSHTAGLGVCAIASSEVGVDVQDTTRPPARLSERYLTPEERTRLLALPESERAARFYVYWTLKEAYVKARGLGLFLPLTQVGFELEPLGVLPGGDAKALDPKGADAHAAKLWLGPLCPDDGQRVWLKSWRASERHRLALALMQPEGASASRGVAATGGADEPPGPSVCIRRDAARGWPL